MRVSKDVKSGIRFEIVKRLLKTCLLIVLGIAISWMTFGFATELKIKNKIENGFEKAGIIYRCNESCENSKLIESELSQLVKQVLAENPKTATLNLNIVTVGSRITISGKAENREQIKSAVQTTLKIPGVKEVISTVVIDPDIEIAHKNSLL